MPLMRLSDKGHPANRIMVLLFTLGILVILAVGLYSGYLDSNKAVDSVALADQQTMLNANPDATPADPLPMLKAHDELNRYHLDVAERTRHWERESNFFGAHMAITEGFSWLKSQSHAKLAKSAWPRGRWTYAKVMREPDRWRGEILHVYGLMMNKQEVEIEDPGNVKYKVWRILLHDYFLKETYTILTPLVPAQAHPPKGSKRGTHLACDAMFLKEYPYLAKGGWKWTPMLLARRVYLAKEGFTPPRLLDERGDPGPAYQDIRPRRTSRQLDLKFLKEKLIRPPKNGIGGVRILTGGGDIRNEARNLKSEKAAYDSAFEYVWHFTDQELADQVNPEINFVTLMQGNQAPAWTMGQIVRFTGRAGEVEPWRFAEDGSGINRIYLVYAHDSRYSDPGFIWVLAVLNLPKGLRVDSAIEAEGVFLKLYPYKTPKGDWHWAPLLICKNIRYIPPSKSNAVFIITLAGLLAVILIAILLASRKDTSSLEAIRLRAHRRRLQRNKEKLRAAQKTAPGADEDRNADLDHPQDDHFQDNDDSRNIAAPPGS